MTREERVEGVGQGLQAGLESAYLEEYLRGCGYSRADLKELPEAEAKQLMARASTYASTRLYAEETRARLVHNVHGVASSSFRSAKHS